MTELTVEESKETEMNRADDKKQELPPQPELDPVLIFADSLQKAYKGRERRKRKGSLHFV
jgi:hypothetical protein